MQSTLVTALATLGRAGHAMRGQVVLRTHVRVVPLMPVPVERATLVRVALVMLAQVAVLMPALAEHLTLVRVVLQIIGPAVLRTRGPAVHAMLVPVDHAIPVQEVDGIAQPFVDDLPGTGFNWLV